MPTRAKIVIRRRAVPATISGGRLRLRRRTTTTKKGLGAAIRRVLNRVNETKFCSIQYDALHNSSIGSADPQALCPSITQGDDDYQRIGDKIRGKYLYIKGKVQWDQSYLMSNGQTFLPPVTLRMLILSQNNIRTNDQITAGSVSYGTLLKDNVGVGTGRAYTGGQWDNLAPINKDLFKVHMDKKVKLNWIKPAIVSGSGTDVTAAGTDHTRYFYCKIKLNKTLKFDSSTHNAPNNFAPFFVMGGVNDDGESAYTTGTPFHVSFLSTLYFTDA